MKQHQTISVIIPIYNVDEFLNRCIKSILSQTFQDIEIVLVDDGSPDSCGMICDQIIKNDSRVTVIHQPNGGLSSARNVGLNVSTSEWITFIDSDDWVHPRYIEYLHLAAQEYKAEIVVGSFRISSEYNPPEEFTNESVLWNTEDYWISHRTNATTAWGKLFKRKLFKSIRFPLQRYHEDEFVIYKLLFQYSQVPVVQRPIYYYFFNGDSISRLDYLLRFPDILQGMKEHYEFFLHSSYKKAFRLEVEKYAECLSEYVRHIKELDEDKDEIESARKQLKDFLKIHKQFIPFELRKDIYISAYPSHGLFIRGFGFFKQLLKGDRK